MPDETPAPQTVAKAELLTQLKTVIQDLESLANRLDATPAETMEIPPTLTTLTTAVTDLAQAFGESESSRIIGEPTRKPVEAEAVTSETEADADWGEMAEPDIDPTTETRDRIEQVQGIWDRVLQTIRTLLPDELNAKLSDWLLTAITSGVVVVVLLLAVLLTPDAPPSPPAAIAPSPSPRTTVAPTPIAPPVSTPPPPTIPVTPPQPKPKRPLRLTPEQKLIASIQEQVAQITDQYAEGLIQSLQVDFLAGRLRVTMGTGWYDLTNDRQDQVASEVLRRARRLDFTKVEMLDPDETLLARNPVIGDQMLVFQRTPLANGGVSPPSVN